MLAISVAVFVGIGAVVWGIVARERVPVVIHASAQLPLKQDAFAEAEALLKAGQGWEAKRALDRVINDPNTDHEQLRRAYEKRGDWAYGNPHVEATIEFYQKALGLADKTKEPLVWARIQAKITTLFFQCGQGKVGEVMLEELIQLKGEHLDPNHPDLLAALEIVAQSFSSWPSQAD